jgi:RNA polymerase sigma-70 factor (ECF subfamily)
MRTGPWSPEEREVGWDRLERQVLEELRAGDRRNLGLLLDRYGEELMGYLTAILGRRESAEDCFQETWVKVMDRIHRFDPGSAFAPWLFRIGRNGAYDRLRRRSRWRWVGLGPSEPNRPAREIEAPVDVGREVVARETAEALLEKLEPAQREMLWMRYFRDLSYEEISSLSGLPVGTVKSRVSRALKRLAAIHEKTGA